MTDHHENIRRALLAERDALREALEVMVEMVEMNGFGRDYAMDVARAALAQGQGGDGASLVTHWSDGTPRDERDIASDPEGTLIHDPSEPLLAAQQDAASPQERRRVMGLWHRFQRAWNQRVFYPAIRLKYLLVTFRNHAEMLNKKVRVEAQMQQCIEGKEPMPDKDKLREWANILGVPERFRREQ